MVEPIALQDNLGKTPAAEKITQIEKSQPEVAQRDSAIEGQRKSVEQQSKPQPAEKSDEVIIHRDREKKEKKNEKKKDPKKNAEADANSREEEQETDEKTPRPVKHLDLRA